MKRNTLIKIDIEKAQELAKAAIKGLEQKTQQAGLYLQGRRYYQGEEKELTTKILGFPEAGKMYQKNKLRNFESIIFHIVICSTCPVYTSYGCYQCYGNKRRYMQGREKL